MHTSAGNIPDEKEVTTLELVREGANGHRNAEEVVSRLLLDQKVSECQAGAAAAFHVICR
jgi:hypothetical protein